MLMSRVISFVMAVALLVGIGVTLSACESTQTAATPSQFDKPFDGSTFKGRRE
jgi:hypothetical protein